MSAEWEFMFAYRIPHTGNEQTLAVPNCLEKQINEQGLDCKHVGKEDIKRPLFRTYVLGQHR